jgi:hypothetical protein
MDEIEFSALNGQCLDRRIPDSQGVRDAVGSWRQDRNNRQPAISWRFTTEDARIKLRGLYQKC